MSCDVGELCSFSKLSVTSPTSQLILEPFPRFTYVTTHSPTLPLLHLRHSSFSNPSFVSPTSQDFHLRHLASRPWFPNHCRLVCDSFIGLKCLYRERRWHLLSMIVHQRIAVVMWHSDPASFYRNCWMNVTVPCTNIYYGFQTSQRVTGAGGNVGLRNTVLNVIQYKTSFSWLQGVSELR